MGRMKEIFMEVMQEYGTIPDGFDVDTYKLKRDLEDAELKEYEEKLAAFKAAENVKTTPTNRNSL